MKEYLKMADVFNGSVGFDCDGDIFDNDAFFGTIDMDKCDVVEHAINSHDELVAQVERLQLVIDRVISTANELSLKSPTTPWGDGYKECALATARALEDMTK